MVSIHNLKKDQSIHRFIIQCPLSTLFHRRFKVIHPNETTLFGSGRSRTVRRGPGGGGSGGNCGGSTSAWLWRERDFQGQKALLFFPPTPPCCSLLVVLLITISTLNVLCLTMTKATLRTVFIANKHTCMLII